MANPVWPTDAKWYLALFLIVSFFAGMAIWRCDPEPVNPYHEQTKELQRMMEAGVKEIGGIGN